MTCETALTNDDIA